MSTSSSTTAVTPNPLTPNFTDDLQWITAYFAIHMMSDNSRRYMYMVWFCVAAIFLVFTILHWSGSRGGFIGAHWSKWALRRRTWRGKHFMKASLKTGNKGESYPISLPPNGQLLCLAGLLVITAVLAAVGPDYISPEIGLFSLKPTLSTRAYDVSMFTKYQPQYTIHKAWWTAGGRMGLIAFALMPLCVLFALKSPPFAIFALPYTTQIHFDKLAWLHRWSGRLIWLVTTAHVALWSVQLVRDRRTSSSHVAYEYTWQYQKFIFGWIAYAVLTFLVAFSFRPLRKAHYEAFYALHILLVPLTLVMAALHHPPVWLWCWAALAVWVGERLWRGARWLHSNGFFGIQRTTTRKLIRKNKDHESQVPRSPQSKATAYPPLSPYAPTLTSPTHNLSVDSDTSSYIPLRGYAHAELLSGATVRLTYVSPGLTSWAPGQHFLIGIPSVARLTTHPFTAASICDEQSREDAGRAIVFLVRSKNGWTRDLWDHVVSLCSRGQRHVPSETLPTGTELPSTGVLLKMYLDGPFGSSVRAKWGSHSNVLIFAGGSGVSFGISILEYVCLCLAGRDGRYLGGRAGGWGQKGFRTRRVRFVWLIREFSHIQWAASTVRRCMDMISSPGLDVDIFVTNFGSAPMPKQIAPPPVLPEEAEDDIPLAPPAPLFMQNNRSHDSLSSAAGSEYSLVDMSYYTGVYGDEEREAGGADLQNGENYTLDLTNFDGDNEIALPGEDMLSRRVRKVGQNRRSMRISKALSMKPDFMHGVEPERGSRLRSNYTHRQSTHSTDGLLSSVWEPSDGRTSPFNSDTEEDLGRVTPLYIDRFGTPTPPASPLANDPSGKALRFAIPPQPPPLIIPTATARRHSPTPSWVGEDTAIPVSPFAAKPGGDIDYQPRLHVHEQELRDMSIVSELARPGKPKIDRILKDEVEEARGSTIVACCGPTSFNAMVRKAIAMQIDPGRIRQGDRRGYIDLVSEEFDF